tara:strand:- start:49175 stop:49456 length:282 start_codon:yes stop_codon:yes gene_type:complete
MDEITIAVQSNTTVITVEQGNSVRKIAVNFNENYKASDSIEKIVFPCNKELNMLFISAKNLSSATLTALTLTENSTILEVFDAFVTAGFFKGN